MLDQTKIVIAGIGGVGGYFGGLLAKEYAEHNTVQIFFIARGKHLEQIREHGLKVINGDESFVAKPYLETSDPSEIGIADFVIICTKNYDLKSILEQLKPCIDQNTILLPLLNGVESPEKIKEVFPKNLVLKGCAYIVSTIKTPGVIENMGHNQKIYFGLDNYSEDRLTSLEMILANAGISATLSTNISSVIWEKFIFLSCIATATSYFDSTIGKLLEEHRETLIELIKEVKTIAISKNITVDPQIIEKSISHYETLPYDATSSMHRDYLNSSSKTELESLTGYVVNEGKRLNIETPLFSTAYKSLLSR